MGESVNHREFQSFLESINEYVVGGIPYRPIIEIMYFYTRRTDEVVSLTTSDVDFDNELITFPVNWRDIDTQLTFNLDPRIAGKLIAARQWNVSTQNASDNSIFGVSYDAVYQKTKDTANELGIEILPKSVQKTRVEHLLAEGYHREQIEYWMGATTSRLREKHEIDSFIHHPLVIDHDDLAITSPDVPRHQDSYNSSRNASTGALWGYPPMPPIIKEVDKTELQIAISRSIYGTAPYNVRKYIYFSDDPIDQDSLFKKLDSSSNRGGTKKLEKIISLLIESGEIIETTRGYKWNDMGGKD